ncbi:MAG: formyltetrahydrofolate deformylase [Candidatus Omnitrophica bacterium]|nr:formyltetrahydrofolate deformylase [Candidatus Omnitrophota bacterium]MBD3269805.1 formyltetrahydrofolate deformylase [Candidatus Omnitrophota bacterium]
MSAAILLISCPDRKGITASITNFIYQNNGNIEHADQHIDSETNTFFMRIAWSLKGFNISPQDIPSEFMSLAKKFDMHWNLYFSTHMPKVAVFVSRHLHCFYDLLLKFKQNYFKGKLSLVVSNCKEVEDIAGNYGINFLYSPKTKGNKKEAEQRELEILKKNEIELLVLARYMQIFSPEFAEFFSNRIINIHHSFLPAFAGGSPYRQAYERGVKIIGATSHYVTEELDSGPIIEQDITRVSHRDSLADLKIEGKELERVVLSRAVRWHLERKILVYGNKTVVFD